MKITFKHKLPSDGTEVEYDITGYVMWRCTHGARAAEIIDLLLAHEYEPSKHKRALLRHLLNVALEDKQK